MVRARVMTVVAAIAALWFPPVMVEGQAASADPAATFDTTGLADGPHSRACMLLERTIFQIDVLTVDLRFGSETVTRIRRLIDAGAGRDSVAAVAMTSRNAYALIEFVRDVGMDRFIDGVRTDLRRAVDAGVIDGATYRQVSDNLPRWYGFLEGRDVREGDRLVYRVRGDTLHSGYRAADGEWLLQQTDVGPERRLAVLGSYLVRGSSFREGLLDSLLVPDGC